MLLDALDLLGADAAARHLAARDAAQDTLLHQLAHYWLPFTAEHQALAPRLLQAVLAAGVSVDARNSAWDTPLHPAAMPCSGFAELLVDAGADVK